jgi:Xaa-Pro aminopeptidase
MRFKQADSTDLWEELMMKHRVLSAVSLVMLLATTATAQTPFTTAFPPEEFAERRAKVIEQIGPDAVAVIRGTGEPPVYMRFRQNNQFFYLTGVQMPNAELVLDGRTKQATLFLTRNERAERMDAYALTIEDALKQTGFKTVLPIGRFSEVLTAIARERKIIYAPFRRESLNSAAPENTVGHMFAIQDDPWDGRVSRELAFVRKLRERFPHAEFRDLDKMLDLMRMIKTPREIEVLREANRVAARAHIEMIRATEPGMKEYAIEAIGQYVFHQHNAKQGFYAQSIAYRKGERKPGRYHSIEDTIREGDMVTVDFGPDYQYYVADIMRTWPATGKYTVAQREAYSALLQFWKDLESTIRPNVAPRDIIKEASVKMEKSLAAMKFTNPKIREAAVALVERMKNNTRNSLGHFVGMDVHDTESIEMGWPGAEVMKPGMVFSIEFGLSLNVPDEGAWSRIEENYVVTETGIENLTSSLPREPDEIEKLMAQPSPFHKASGGTQ